MPNQQKKKQTPAQQQYQKLAKEKEAKRPLAANIIRAFIVGGLISVIGQGLQMIFIQYLGFNEENAGNPTSAVLIMIAVLLTGLGVYDKIAQWSGAGTAVPVTGFANSIAAAAIEHRSEGFVLGVAGKMFKIAGCVIVYGVFAAFAVAIIKIIIQSLGGR